MEIKLGQGYKPGSGNNPADNILQEIIPNTLVGKSDELFALARKNSLWTLSFGLACCAIGDDEHAHVPSRLRPLRRRHVAFPATGRRHDRRWNGRQEDGRADQAPLRADARPQVGDRYGKLRYERRALLPLLLRRHGRRSPHPRRCLRARLSTPSGGPHVRPPPTPRKRSSRTPRSGDAAE